MIGIGFGSGLIPGRMGADPGATANYTYFLICLKEVLVQVWIRVGSRKVVS